MVTSGVPGDTEVLRLLRQVTATPPEPHRARPRSSRHQWSLRPLSRRALNDCLDMFASPPATFLPSQRTGRRHDSRGTARRTPAGLPEREGAAYIAPGTSDKRGLADEFRCHGVAFVPGKRSAGFRPLARCTRFGEMPMLEATG
jgi:hypothetical protein